MTEGNATYTKKTLVKMKPSRFVFHVPSRSAAGRGDDVIVIVVVVVGVVVAAAVSAIVIVVVGVGVGIVVAAAATVSAVTCLKGFISSAQNFFIRIFLLQPSFGKRGTTTNQKIKVTVPIKKGNMIPTINVP